MTTVELKPSLTAEMTAHSSWVIQIYYWYWLLPLTFLQCYLLQY